MRAHAVLSPSAAARWMSCTPSARMEEKMPDRETEFAKEGTLAHALAEAKVWERYGTGKPEDMDGLRREGLYAPEMEEHTDAYADYVHGLYAKHRETTPDAVLMTEQRLDFTKYIPDGFGTADAVIVAEGMMEVVDFKYGKGVEVSAVENGQMMVYALGALEKWDYLYPIERVRMTIFQPRIGNVSEWEITATALRKWGEEELKPKAAKAFKGEGEATPGGVVPVLQSQGGMPRVGGFLHGRHRGRDTGCQADGRGRGVQGIAKGRNPERMGVCRGRACARLGVGRHARARVQGRGGAQRKEVRGRKGRGGQVV